MIPQPLRIHSDGVALSATRYGRGARRLLLLPPLAEERKGCVRPLRDVACRWAENGGSAFLFDYAGTGDSPGVFSDVTWESLARNVSDVCTAVLSDGDTGEVYVLGARLGARLALAVAEGQAAVAGMCFWEPVLDGAAWWSEICRRSRFRLGAVQRDARDVDGYVFSEALVQSLETQESDLPKPECNVHLLSIGGGGTVPAATERMAVMLGAAVERVRMQPFWLETDVPETTALVDATMRAFGVDEKRSM